MLFPNKFEYLGETKPAIFLGALTRLFLGTLSPGPAKGARCPLWTPPRQDCILNLRIRTVRAKAKPFSWVNSERGFATAIHTGQVRALTYGYLGWAIPMSKVR